MHKDEKQPAEEREQIPVAVINKVLGGKSNVRVVIMQHPTRDEMAACVPYKDYAEAFSYDDTAIFKMIKRTPWIEKHQGTAIMAVPSTALDGRGGGYQATLCLFEEGALGLFMKLQPTRCKDPEVGARVDQLQEELILVLRDALRGYRQETGGGYKSADGMLPRPGLSMDAISDLCKEADKQLKGKVSLRALNYFTGMPVNDLVEEIENEDPASSANAGTIVQYLHALLPEDLRSWDIEKTTASDGTVSLTGTAAKFLNAFLFVCRKEQLPKLFSSATAIGVMFSHEAKALEFLGWKCTQLPKIGGYRPWRFELMKNQIQ